MNADGSDVTQITNNATTVNGDPAVDGSPAWSPDGTKIAFTSDRINAGDIFTINIDGTNLVNLTNY